MRSSVGCLVVIWPDAAAHAEEARTRGAAAGNAPILSPSRETRVRPPPAAAKKVRARMGSVPASLREDAPNAP
ncbi:hypothetical protein BLAT2472_60342 [Burkholderia latens]